MKQKCPEFENHERWLVSFADMMTLLFALFVVLFSLKDEGGETTELDQAAAAVGESFNMVMEDIPVERRVGPTEVGYGIFEHLRGDQIRPPISKKFPGTKQHIKDLDQEMGRVKMEIENRLYGPNKMPPGKEGGDGQARVVSVHREPDGFRVQLLARHFYKPGSYKIRRSAKKDVNEVAKVLKDLGRNISIEGHTDSLPSHGNLSNWELSALRASFLLRYLINQHYFPPTRLSAAGYADTKPIAHNGSEAGRGLNRRIEIKISYDD